MGKTRAETFQAPTLLPTMHSRFVLHLPNEILAIIINELALDNLNEDDVKDSFGRILSLKGKILAALASCRLASHVLCSLATPLLFSSILLTDADNYGSSGGYSLFLKRATSLNDILATGNIAASIHSLTVHIFHYYNDGILQNSSIGAIMSAILHRLPHIQKFSLNATYTSFRSLAMNFAAAIEALCRSPNLTTLYLDCILHFPFTTIRTSPNLRCLRLCHSDLAVNLNFSVLSATTYFYLFQFDNVNSSSHLLQLESLEVDSEIVGMYKDVSIANCFSHLENLQLKNLYYHTPCFSHGWDIMLLASQTLKKLELTVDGFYSRSQLGCALRLLLTHDKMNQ